MWVYHWKKDFIGGFNPKLVSDLIPNLGEGNIITAIKNAANGRSFYYSLAYCLLVLIFGIRRIKRRKTPYVKRQTLVLNLFQWIPLFILPYIIFPWMGSNGWFADGGFWQWFGETFFSNGKGEGTDQYWRAFGFILAWPLFIFNAFTEQPLWGWLILSLIQTFVIIPLIVRRFGKGGYCGWICSCGALAETLGDAHRQKMPHGPLWTKMNMIGQFFLWSAFGLLFFRIIGWVWPGSFWEVAFNYLLKGAPLSDKGLPIFNYSYFVDLLWAGVIGVSFYFHFSGRVWCRFACPLSALMQIYQKAFGKFRIFADKNKCISCNVCTSVCHQGIDIMNFANKGKPMEDPECVRCSACVQQCPTGVLNFGYWLLGVSVAFFALESLRPWRKDQPKFRKDFWLDAFYMFFNFFLFSLIIYNAVSTVVVDWFHQGLSTIGINNLVAIHVENLPVWAKLLILFVVRDFIQWNIHRLLHRVPALWEFHKVHHSVKEMGFAAHLRFHWMESVIYRVIGTSLRDELWPHFEHLGLPLQNRLCSQ